jgi:hypothetical protein
MFVADIEQIECPSLWSQIMANIEQASMPKAL